MNQLTPVAVWSLSDDDSYDRAAAIMWFPREGVLTELALLVKNLVPGTRILMVDSDWTYNLGM